MSKSSKSTHAREMVNKLYNNLDVKLKLTEQKDAHQKVKRGMSIPQYDNCPTCKYRASWCWIGKKRQCLKRCDMYLVDEVEVVRLQELARQIQEQKGKQGNG